MQPLEVTQRPLPRTEGLYGRALLGLNRSFLRWEKDWHWPGTGRRTGLWGQVLYCSAGTVRPDKQGQLREENLPSGQKPGLT